MWVTFNCRNNNTCYAIGYNGTILKTTTGRVSSIKEIPNPSIHNVITINNNFNVIYDILGRKIDNNSIKFSNGIKIIEYQWCNKENHY